MVEEFCPIYCLNFGADALYLTGRGKRRTKRYRALHDKHVKKAIAPPKHRKTRWNMDDDGISDLPDEEKYIRESQEVPQDSAPVGPD